MTSESRFSLKSANVTLLPPGVAVLPFAGIPGHLIFYGAIMILSVLIYFIIELVKKYIISSDTNIKPSFIMMLFGKEDDWLTKERGVAVHHYIMFLRLYLQLAGVFCFISGVSLSINVSQNTDMKLPLFVWTTSISIPPSSDLNWINLVISFLTPWLVVYMVNRMSKKIEHLKPLTKTFNRTLLVESSVCGFEKDEVVEYLIEKYLEFKLIDKDAQYYEQLSYISKL